MSSVATMSAATARFHLSLNVNDLNAFVPFLQALLGCPPLKRHADYAKFEPEELPLVLSLTPRTAPAGATLGIAGQGPLNHLGFRVRDAGALVEIQQRLEAAGFATQREDGVDCCHSKQTKFWVRDPEANVWELYILEKDDEPLAADRAAHDPSSATPAPLRMSSAQQLPVVEAVSAEAAQPTIWTHRLDEDLPESLAAGGYDEIQLQGSFNSQRFAGAHDGLLRRALAALRPGGKLLVHALVTDRELNAAPRLPGPAAVVSHVPRDEQVVADVEAAGFVAVELARFSDAPCFQCDGVGMRELQLIARKPETHAPTGCSAVVVYKGPLAHVADEQGNVFARGRRTAVDAATRDRLQHSSAAGQFAFPVDEACSSDACQG